MNNKYPYIDRKLSRKTKTIYLPHNIVKYHFSDLLIYIDQFVTLEDCPENSIADFLTCHLLFFNVGSLSKPVLLVPINCVLMKLVLIYCDC